MTTTIEKWGKSHAVRLPKAIVDQAGFGEGSEVEVRVEGDSVVIAPRSRRKRIPIAELVKGMTPAKNRFPEFEDGPVGREVI